MKTVRRLYILAVAFISVEVVTWGLINLLRSLLGDIVGGSGEILARALALMLVGLPIFLFHWLWAQRLAASDAEEHSASLRAVFLYGMLLATLVPLAQNMLALINRGLLSVLGLQIGRAILGSSSAAADNLIAIAVNGLLALYFWNILRLALQAPQPMHDFADVRRLYRYVWVIYGLLMTLFGAQQILRYILFIPSGLLGEMTRETIINGLALLIVGTPIWVYSWAIVQRSLGDEVERDSHIRLAILYLLALGGVITVLTSLATVLHTLMDILLGIRMTSAEAVNKMGGPLSVGLPLGVVWAYYGHWLSRHIDSITEPARRVSLHRIHAYILSALGLGGTFLGVAMLAFFLSEMLIGRALVMDDALRTRLGRALGVIIAWLPLWIFVWRRLQWQVADGGEPADHARRSLVRRAYLFLAVFAGVIGGMVFAVALLFELLQIPLTPARSAAFPNAVLNNLLLLVLFAILLAYHLVVMRSDNRYSASALAGRRTGFKLLILDVPRGFGAAAGIALTRVAPALRPTVTATRPRGKFDALIMSGSALLASPPWVRSFTGHRIVVPDQAERLHWAGGVEPDPLRGAALTARRLAEGQSPPRPGSHSGWMIIVYIAAALFGAELLILLISALASTLMR